MYVSLKALRQQVRQAVFTVPTVLFHPQTVARHRKVFQMRDGPQKWDRIQVLLADRGNIRSLEAVLWINYPPKYTD